MPRIPQHESEVGINVGASPTGVPQSSGEMGNRMHRQTKETLEAVRVFEKTVQGVHDFRQTNEAEAYIFEGIKVVEGDAEENGQNEGFKTGKYDAKIDDLISNAAKTFDGNMAREKFLVAATQQATMAKWGIKNKFHAKEQQAAKASITYKMLQVSSLFADMPEEERIRSVANVTFRLAEAVKTGVMYEEEAAILLFKFGQDTAETVFYSNIVTDPEGTLAKLNDTEKISYPLISDEDKVKAKATIEDYLNKQKVEAARLETAQVQQNEDDILARNNDPSRKGGAPTIPELKKKGSEKLAANGKITPQFEKTMMGILTKADVYNPNALDSMMKYNELLEREKAIQQKESFLGENSTFEEVIKFKADVLKAKDNNEIDVKTMNEFLTDKAANLPIKRDKVFQEALDRLKAQSAMYSSDEAQIRVKNKMYKSLLEKVQGGQGAWRATEEVINETLSEAMNNPIKGEKVKAYEKMVDAMGDVYLIPLANIAKAKEKGLTVVGSGEPSGK